MITENNKIIAEFMGGGKEYEIDINTKTIKSYNNSWDWLMPVVQKCFKIDNLDLYIKEGFNCPLFKSVNLVDAVATLDIDGTYEAVIEFIKEYNNN